MIGGKNNKQTLRRISNKLFCNSFVSVSSTCSASLSSRSPATSNHPTLSGRPPRWGGGGNRSPVLGGVPILAKLNRHIPPCDRVLQNVSVSKTHQEPGFRDEPHRQHFCRGGHQQFDSIDAWIHLGNRFHLIDRFRGWGNLKSSEDITVRRMRGTLGTMHTYVCVRGGPLMPRTCT